MVQQRGANVERHRERGTDALLAEMVNAALKGSAGEVLASIDRTVEMIIATHKCDVVVFSGGPLPA